MDIRTRLCSTIAFASVTAFADADHGGEGACESDDLRRLRLRSPAGSRRAPPALVLVVDAVLAAARAEAGPFFRIVVRQEALAA